MLIELMYLMFHVEVEHEFLKTFVYFFFYNKILKINFIFFFFKKIFTSHVLTFPAVSTHLITANIRINNWQARQGNLCTGAI